MSQSPFTNSDASPAMLTSHAMLIPWGRFAVQIGLVAALEQVPIAQRQRDHPPQSKLIEFVVSILGGCAYPQDISRSSHPLDQDRVVAQAWGPNSWADYSGVSRTLQACDEGTVLAVQEALAAISQPFIERALNLALAEMVVQGVSTRKVKAVIEQRCGTSVSSTQVSRAAAGLTLPSNLPVRWSRTSSRASAGHRLFPTLILLEINIPPLDIGIE